jgi:thiol-disulfide isomerase/thioredoxin|tara:strand:+ start:58 stop:528 length:471 start_codon:yes stop_codon:yes gene_type:complete
MSLDLDYKKYSIWFIVAVLFIGLAFYVYSSYISPKINPQFVENKEIVSSMDDDTNNITAVDVILFKVDWCPHSKKAIPIWTKLKSIWDNKSINGKKLIFKMFDGDTQEAEINSFEDKYKKRIDGYPTIVLVKDNEIIEYDAKPEIKTFEEFLNTVV